MISDILKSLPKKERELLTYAFEHELSQYVEYVDKRFIGVNINSSNFKHLKIETVAGNWSEGDVK